MSRFRVRLTVAAASLLLPGTAQAEPEEGDLAALKAEVAALKAAQQAWKCQDLSVYQAGLPAICGRP